MSNKLRLPKWQFDSLHKLHQQKHRPVGDLMQMVAEAFAANGATTAQVTFARQFAAQYKRHVTWERNYEAAHDATRDALLTGRGMVALMGAWYPVQSILCIERDGDAALLVHLTNGHTVIVSEPCEAAALNSILTNIAQPFPAGEKPANPFSAVEPDWLQDESELCVCGHRYDEHDDDTLICDECDCDEFTGESK